MKVQCFGEVKKGIRAVAGQWADQLSVQLTIPLLYLPGQVAEGSPSCKLSG
jgi:hypothetical protein